MALNFAFGELFAPGVGDEAVADKKTTMGPFSQTLHTVHIGIIWTHIFREIFQMQLTWVQVENVLSFSSKICWRFE